MNRGNEAGQQTARICKDCNQNPTMSARCPYCSSCMQRRATAARQKKKGDSKAEVVKAATHRQPAAEKDGESKRTSIRVDFGGCPEVLSKLERLAAEEVRPIELQIIYILKNQLRGCKSSSNDI